MTCSSVACGSAITATWLLRKVSYSAYVGERIKTVKLQCGSNRLTIQEDVLHLHELLPQQLGRLEVLTQLGLGGGEGRGGATNGYHQ